ncbi:MAG: flagellar biosynthesis protein FlhB [Thalassospira sp.]|nr:flagellar biosynthesis protein FlhB [Thalassospira sp.]
MSEDTDESQKTEEPSQRKLDQAREKGQVISSKEVSNWLALFAGAVLTAYALPSVGMGLVQAFIPMLESSHDFNVDSLGSVNTLITDITLQVFLLLAVFMVILILAGIGGNALQTGFLVSWESVQPKLEKISPIAGFKRLFSKKSLVEFLKGIFKISIVAGVGYFAIQPMLKGIDTWVTMTVPGSLHILQDLLSRLFVGVLAILFVIAVLDYVFQRFDFLKQMRMSRHELREEYKDTEGDPHIKGKLKQQRAERAGKRALTKVPEASVIITNPTHYAIALKYEKGQSGAPIVLAKGVDFLAQKIRELAIEHKIPIVENPPLARALYAACDIDEEVPFEHYKAVADVISYVFRLKGKLRRP